MSEFHEWFTNKSHRAKYQRDHPAYLAAKETWDELQQQLFDAKLWREVACRKHPDLREEG